MGNEKHETRNEKWKLENEKRTMIYGKYNKMKNG
jgi:hypothetical protein